VTSGSHNISHAENDIRSRELIRTELDQTLVVEAAAGTGKTSELVNRIVAVLRSGRVRIEQIVAVTFTHKAAGELKLRLRQELDDARESAKDQELNNLEDALKRLEEASIGTIHSFCAQILRERPVEARVDPAFQDLPEQEQRRLYSRAFRNWFERALNESRPGLHRVLSRLAWSGGDAGSPVEQLEMAGWKLIEWRDYRGSWRREPFDRDAEVAGLTAAVRNLATLSAHNSKHSDELYRALAPVRELSSWIERSVDNLDKDTLEALLLKLQKDVNKNKPKGRGPYSESVRREDVLAVRHDLFQHIDLFRRRADADLAALLQAEMQDLIIAYEELKQRAGKLDFVDLLLKVRNLVRDDREVRTFLQDRCRCIFIDEFQDTDPLQAELLLLLAADDPAETDARRVKPAPGKLFIVGDPKQSIYRFRRADVAVYQEVRNRLVEAGGRLLHLTKSFRAVRPIQECINAAFAPDMQEDEVTAQAGYVALDGDRLPIEGQPSVVVLPAPVPWTGKPPTKKDINECLPGAITGFIEWLIRESGWKVRDSIRADRQIPIAARHVAVLFRRFLNYGDDITRPYVRSLEARDIPHLLVASKSFHQREEVETLRAACIAIEWPDDELSVYATLRGALFAISDGLLLRYRLEKGRMHPLRPQDTSTPKEYEPIAKAIDILAVLHRKRNRRPIAETVNRLLEATRAHIGFALRPGGQQVLANVYRVAELARSFELTGGVSFRGFVDELTARSQSNDSGEAPMIEESADGVRLLTVHTAKGLEFPVVILADMTANLSARDPDRYVEPGRGLCATRLIQYAPFEWLLPWDLLDNMTSEKAREESEGVRVAYVASTRARDLLVIPAVGSQPIDGWLSPLNKAIQPERPERRRSRPAIGCPAFGPSTMTDGPDAEAVRPGLHKPQAGVHEVVWWDPSVLRLTAEAKLG